MNLRFVLLGLILLTPLHAEEDDPWAPFRYFVGRWTKTEEGIAGAGGGHREYEFVLKGQYLHWRNTSTFPPQKKNPKGEVHEDWGILSYDKNRKRILLRQFHGEGFVHHSVLEEISPDRKRFVFVTEKIENIAPGWRARITIEIRGKDEFVETFDLARPGEDFSPGIINRLKRR